MPIHLLKQVLRAVAIRYPRAAGLYRRLARPDGLEWASYLKASGGIYAMGEHCSVQPGAVITDPAHVRMGNNVRLSTCTLLGHDGSVNMINRAYSRRLDRVGKIDIGDNVFIGQGVIVLPGTVIESNVVVGAGAVVRGRIRGNAVVAGVPARPLGTLDALVERMEADLQGYPWRHLIAARGPGSERGSQAELDRLRSAHFFGAGAPADGAAPELRPQAVGAGAMS